MSLTKQDLQAIKTIVDSSIDNAITSRIQPMISEAVEELRLHTAVGFAGVDERFAEVDKRFERIDQRFERVDQRFDRMDKRFDRMEKRQSDIEEQHLISQKTVRKVELQHHAASAHLEEYDIRFRRLEKHTGLSSA
jgi:septation ring formation regulator EzrA